MKKGKIDLSKWLIFYGIVNVSFHILPALFPGYVQKPITHSNMLDFVTPFVVIPVGFLLISIALIFASYRIPHKSRSPQNLCLICAGEAFYGFIFAVNGTEGQTVVFVIPAALVGVVVSGGKRFKLSQNIETNPIRIFFFWPI
jgi:hypothetical protein